MPTREQRAKRLGVTVDQLPPDGRGRHGNHARGSASGKWNHRIISSHGYVKVRVGRSHPLSDPNGYTYEHLLVWIAAGRPAPKPNELIHHRNEDKTDNRIDNLELITRSGHAVHHSAERQRDGSGRFASTSAPVS